MAHSYIVGRCPSLAAPLVPLWIRERRQSGGGMCILKLIWYPQSLMLSNLYFRQALNVHSLVLRGSELIRDKF